MEFIGFVFVQILLVAAAAVVGAICWLVVRRATYQVTIGRSWALLIAFLFPLLVVFYLEAGLFAYGIAEYALGKDSFLNGIYHYPLVNGYQLVIFDKMPEMAYIEQSAGSDTNGVSEVRAVQVAATCCWSQLTEAETHLIGEETSPPTPTSPLIRKRPQQRITPRLRHCDWMRQAGASHST